MSRWTVLDDLPIGLVPAGDCHRLVAAAELRAKRAQLDRTPATATAERVRLAHVIRQLERELDR